jgi:hypothetical protein
MRMIEDAGECRRKIIARGDPAIPKSCPKCGHGSCTEPGFATARDELGALLTKRRFAREETASILKSLDAEIAALESAREQIDRANRTTTS